MSHAIGLEHPTTPSPLSLERCWAKTNGAPARKKKARSEGRVGQPLAPARGSEATATATALARRSSSQAAGDITTATGAGAGGSVFLTP